MIIVDIDNTMTFSVICLFGSSQIGMLKSFIITYSKWLVEEWKLGVTIHG